MDGREVSGLFLFVRFIYGQNASAPPAAAAAEHRGRLSALLSSAQYSFRFQPRCWGKSFISLKPNSSYLRFALPPWQCYSEVTI